MPRNNRSSRSKKEREAADEAELRLENLRGSIPRQVTRRGVDYTVQNVNGNTQDGKSWLCPHCNVEIKTGTPHVVAWDSVRGPGTRRHFHSNCFNSFQGPLL